MKSLVFFVFTVIILSPISAFAQNNADLQRMFDEDQEARQSEMIDWETLDEQDKVRRDAVVKLLSNGEIVTGEDYFNAAVILQHGEAVEDIRLAHSLATVSAVLGYSRANWLKAASWDRLMMYFDQPQWYGTQYTIDDSGNWQLYEVQSDAITDKQRADWSVPSLEEANAVAKERSEP